MTHLGTDMRPRIRPDGKNRPTSAKRAVGTTACNSHVAQSIQRRNNHALHLAGRREDVDAIIPFIDHVNAIASDRNTTHPSTRHRQAAGDLERPEIQPGYFPVWWQTGKQTIRMHGQTMGNLVRRPLLLHDRLA